MAIESRQKSAKKSDRAQCKCYFEFRCFYPEENPKDALDSITDALVFVGVFDDLKKSK